MGSEKHRQPTMKRYPLLSVVPKQNVLPSRETLCCNVFMYDCLEYTQWKNTIFKTNVN
jgi:hypothetical protein